MSHRVLARVCFAAAALWATAEVRAAEVLILDSRRFDNANNGSIDLDIFMGSSLRDGAAINCNLRLSGSIEKGDAEKIRTAVKQIAPTPFLNIPRLCFKSEGGNYAEAFEIIKVLSEIHVGTGLEPNASCVSACAVAFMGGYFPWKGSLNRFIHPTSTLAFHAPHLLGPSVETDKQGVIAKFYDDGIKAVRRLIEVGRDNVPNFLPNDLLDQMLSKGPNETFAVNTIGKAIRYRIHLYDAKVPAFSEHEFCNVCTNYYYGAREEYGARGKPVICVDAVARQPDRQRFARGTRLLFDAAPRGGSCVVDVVQSSEAISGWYFRPDIPVASQFGDEGPSLQFAYWYLYPPDTPLRSLARR